MVSRSLRSLLSGQVIARVRAQTCHINHDPSPPFIGVESVILVESSHNEREKNMWEFASEALAFLAASLDDIDKPTNQHRERKEAIPCRPKL